MANRLLKGLAVAAGLGLVIGVGSGRRRPGEISMDKDLRPDHPSPEPLPERLDRIESRIRAVEAQPVNELDERICKQAEEIASLQLQLSDHRQKVAGEVAAIEKRFADITKAIPAALESIMVPRIEDLRAHLRSETQQTINSSLTKFERAIDDKVSERIDTLEKTLLDQSTVVSTLSQRAVETDMHLQRLVAAVERLCERGGGAVPFRQEPSTADLPFQRELSEAVKRQADSQPPEFESAFRPRIVKDDDVSRRPHVPWAPL
ncbi:MAG TPA: hypothetical protein VK789_15145 [Bryobacteraceae bacterium]|nr:hypothetical protein [Bryobacteraceae bacterium]